MKKKYILLLLCLALLLCSCSAAPSGNKGQFANPGVNDYLNGAQTPDAGQDGVLSDRKLIRRITLTAETEDMDALLTGLNSHIATLGGYVESRNIQNGSAYSGRGNRSATLVVRIPAAQLDKFVQSMAERSNIVSTVETSDDVTLQYVDIQSRLKVLRTEEERLLQFLAEAASVSEMLEIEKRLTQVQSDIDSLTAQLKTYDNLVDYGTVTLNISEVEVYTPTAEPGLWQTVQETFSRSLAGLAELGRGLLVFALGYSPYFAVLAVIGGGIFLIIWAADRHQKKKAKKNEAAK